MVGTKRSPLVATAMAVAVVVSLSVAACNTIPTNEPPPAPAQASDTGMTLPPDIKQILTAGGLDADNPAGPAPGSISVAAAPAAPPPSPIGVASSTQLLLAAQGISPARPLLQSTDARSTLVQADVAAQAPKGPIIRVLEDPAPPEPTAAPIRLPPINMATATKPPPRPSARKVVMPAPSRPVTTAPAEQRKVIRRF